MAVYRSTSEPNTMVRFSLLPMTEKLWLTSMPWRSTTKLVGAILKALLTYNDTNLVDVEGDLMWTHIVTNESQGLGRLPNVTDSLQTTIHGA